MSVCPITARPGQILGHRKNGSPIFAIAGASPDGDAASGDTGQQSGQAGGQADGQTSGSTGTGASDSGQSSGQQSGQSDGQNNGATTDPFKGWDGKVETLPDRAQKLLRDARKEAGDARAAKNTETERVKAILKAAGIETDADDPVKVLETTRAENTTLSTENRTLKVQLAMGTAARTHGADEALLVAVLAHAGELAKLDPTADDFASKLDALVKTTVEKNPKLKDTQAASASGVSGTGGPGEHADIDAQIEAATKAGDHQRAIHLKRQKQYAQTRA